jgi:glycosyltransferase involved in cell wall biosynthesis/SAM-dependent methyltransferase
MRVLFVAWRDLEHPKAGGSEVVHDALARGLQARGHEVALLCGGPTGPRAYSVVENGGTYSQYLTAPFRYARHFRDVDVVVDVVNGMPYFSPAWRRGPRLALVTHVHTDQWAQYFPRPVAATASLVERVGLRVAYRNTRFFTISPSSAADLEALGVDPGRIHVMQLGASVEQPTRPVARSPEPMFVALGRLAPNKRLDLLLDLWARVAPETGGRLVIVGDGPERERLAERIRTEPALHGVALEGRVSEARKAELFGQAWLLVHTADHEGWGLVILEAALCGTPSLAYDVPGVRDAVQGDVTGVLVDTDAAFVEQWIALAGDAARRERLGSSAAERASTFTWDRCVDEFVAAAEAAIADRRGSAARPALDKNLHLTSAIAATALLTASTPADVAADVGSAEQRAAELRSAGPSSGIARSVHLVKLFRREVDDPDTFYHYLAADVVRQISRFQDPKDALAIDIGGGPGYTSEALRAAGAHCVVADCSVAELGLHNRRPESAVQCDARALPLRDSSMRIVCSSNMLEHVETWQPVLSEMVRVLEPDTGLAYLTFGNWYSPWGGHETSPWHYLGGRHAADRYARRYGKRPKNEYGSTLFRLDISEVLAWFHARDDVEVVWLAPRYWPDWMRWVSRIPAVREVANWNTMMMFRRRSAPDRR